MDRWELIKRFRLLVERGAVNDITCPDCSHEVVFLIGEDDQPIIYCPWDGNKFSPGTGFFADMRAVVTEHYI